MRKSKLVYGVGINDSESPVYKTEKTNGKTRNLWMCPFYKTWVKMLERCYSEKWNKRYKTYVECVACDEWHTFSTFREWMKRQDWVGCNLDKDLMVRGNKLYSPDTCVFISPALNKFLTDSAASRTIYPKGVCAHRKTGKYMAQCSNPFSGKRGYIGLYSTPELAHDAWRRRKLQFALQYAESCNDERIAEALRRLSF